MVAYENQLCKVRRHHLLEMLAFDHAYKSQGIGKDLVRSTCEIADKARLPTFLQSGSAKYYYLRLGMGFRVEK